MVAKQSQRIPDRLEPRRTDIGMQREKLLTFETPLFRYTNLDQQVAFVDALLEKIRAIPGVVTAGASSHNLVPTRSVLPSLPCALSH